METTSAPRLPLRFDAIEPSGPGQLVIDNNGGSSVPADYPTYRADLS